jgi:hypothetical protein
LGCSAFSSASSRSRLTVEVADADRASGLSIERVLAGDALGDDLSGLVVGQPNDTAQKIAHETLARLRSAPPE